MDLLMEERDGPVQASEGPGESFEAPPVEVLSGRQGSKEADATPELSIVICSYRRNDLLKTSLAGCLKQSGLGRGALEIVVVDNCADRTAQPLVRSLADGAESARVLYVNEPRTNLALARSAGVRNASGRFVAFIDDDNILPPEWARISIDIIKQRDADCLFGDVDPVFPSSAPADLVDELRPLFVRHVEGDENGVVTPVLDGHIPAGRTCNVILRRETCFPISEAPWFDPVFGFSGGEDIDYFTRLALRLAPGKILTSRQNLMEEFIPNDRLDKDYLVKKFYRGAQNFALAQSRNCKRPFLVKSYILASGAIQAFYRGAMVLGWRLLGKTPPTLLRVELALALGKLNGKGLLSNPKVPYR